VNYLREECDTVIVLGIEILLARCFALPSTRSIAFIDVRNQESKQWIVLVMDRANEITKWNSNHDGGAICRRQFTPLGVKANDVEIKNCVARPLRSIVLDRIRRARERSGLLDASADIAFGLDVERSA